MHRSKRPQAAVKAVAIITTLIFLPLSLGLPLHRLLQARAATTWLPPYLLAPSMLALSILGLSPWSVCLLLVVGILAVVVAWRTVRRGWLRVLLAAGMLAMMVFPFVFRYQPAVLAAPGHTLILVTTPESFCEQVRRQSETYWEIQRCQYELVGWDENETLFYNESCGEAPTRLFSYDPEQQTPPAIVDAVPDTLYPIVTDPKAIGYVRADVYPASAEESVRALSFPRPWIISPTGRWVAAVARHIYGPEDVIIVSTSEQ